LVLWGTVYVGESWDEYVGNWYEGRDMKQVSYSITSLKIWYHETTEMIDMKQWKWRIQGGALCH
jgi:hypothetical protein